MPPYPSPDRYRKSRAMNERTPAFGSPRGCFTLKLQFEFFFKHAAGVAEELLVPQSRFMFCHECRHRFDVQPQPDPDAHDREGNSEQCCGEGPITDRISLTQKNAWVL